MALSNRKDGLRIFGGAVAIVTGGASGIGRALAEALAARGASVTLVDIQGDLAQDVANQIVARGGQASAKQLNVANPEAVQHLVNDTIDRCGRIDYMFNNAGIRILGPAEQHTIDDWNQILDVNLRGVINGVHAAYPIMRKQGFGHIVNVASCAGLLPFPWLVGYVTSKHAVVGLSLSLRIEAELANVRVSVVCPGAVRTPLLFGQTRAGAARLQIPDNELRRQIEALRPMDAAPFAKRVLRLIARNRAIIVVPAGPSIYWWLYRLAPGFFMKLCARKLKSSQARTG
jgi:NAD(P)-dependent dehydrogenase (short-subunit alcohol dehydrogenase family)